MVTHLGTIEIEVPVRLIADFACGCDNGRNSPVQSGAGSHFAVGQDRVIEPRHSVSIPEIVRYTVTGLLQICPYIQRDVLAHFVLDTRSWQHGIEKPLRGYFPANSSGGKNRVFAFDIDADTDHELQIRAVNVSATRVEREIETVPPQIIELGIVHSGLPFGPHDN